MCVLMLENISLTPKIVSGITKAQYSTITYLHNRDVKVDGPVVVQWVLNDFSSRVYGTALFPVTASSAKT